VKPREHWAQAYGCPVRLVPELGSQAPGPFFGEFEVTRDLNGTIVKIIRHPPDKQVRNG
jgi:hypothetical protein